MPKGRQRTQKFYFKNEAEVMKDLGLTPTKGSGSGWIEKEDGYNDHVIAQLKSTDKQSYKLNHLDLAKLEHNAMVENKIPMFILQFLSNDSRYALVNIEDIPALAEYIETGEVKMEQSNIIKDFIEGGEELSPVKPKRTIKSSASAREKFHKEKQDSWERKKWK